MSSPDTNSWLEQYSAPLRALAGPLPATPHRQEVVDLEGSDSPHEMRAQGEPTDLLHHMGGAEDTVPQVDIMMPGSTKN